MIGWDPAYKVSISVRSNAAAAHITKGNRLRRQVLVLGAALLVISGGGCRAVDTRFKSVDSCALALAPHSGADAIDREIIRLQQAAHTAGDQTRMLEQLGWAYIQKSRISFDQSFYKLAEQCAICIESQLSDSAEALLLRGHVVYSLHRFREAEAIARRLSETRAAPFDFGLLGDALMEQGRLNEAVGAYQKMLDLKPGPQAYIRVAHIRWLKGDLEGALEMIRKATASMGPRDAESLAWAYARMALYELQNGSAKNAEGACQAALQMQANYAPALSARSRALLAQNRNEESVRLMKLAASINPTLENKWLLAEALRASGRNDEARDVEDALIQTGAAEDPRTLSLFLATRREQPETALKLVTQEVKSRDDVFTLDALAWALASVGRVGEAYEAMQRAVAEGTKDARLFYHAGSIAAMNGKKLEARAMLNRAAAIKQMLLPTEREGLSKALAQL